MKLKKLTLFLSIAIGFSFTALSTHARNSIESPQSIESCQKEGYLNNVFFDEIDVPEKNKLSNKLNKDVIIEFFSYACRHCSDMFTILTDEVNDTLKKEIVLVPVSFNPMWAKASKLYYALLASDLDSTENHLKIYNAIHNDKLMILTNDKVLDKFLIDKFGAENASKIKNNMNSFGVDGKVRAATQLSTEYQISGTPTFFIDNKDGKTYKAEPSKTTTKQELLNRIKEFKNKPSC